MIRDVAEESDSPIDSAYESSADEQSASDRESSTSDEDASERQPSSSANVSGYRVGPPHEALTEENCVSVPAMLSLKKEEQQEALLRMVVNGWAVDDLDAEVSETRGPHRYLRADGIGCCIAYGMSGAREDGKDVSVLAHLNSFDYQQDEDGGPTYPALAKLKERIALKNELGATNETSSRGHNLPARRKEALRDADVHKTSEQGSADYVLDTRNFGLFLAGERDKDGVAEVGDSVQEFPMVDDLFRADWQEETDARDRAYEQRMKDEKKIFRTKKTGRNKTLKKMCTIL